VPVFTAVFISAPVEEHWVTLTFDLDFAKPFTELKFGLSTDLRQKVKRFR